jgi:hypothetical protein
MQTEIQTRGRPKDFRVREFIVEVMDNGLVSTRESLRVEVSRRLGRFVSWNTIDSHLSDLVGDGMIVRQAFERRSRPIVLYLKRGSRIQG